MKKTIPFDLLRQGENIYFNIFRLQQLEQLLNKPIIEIIQKQYMGIDFCLAGLQVGLKHHYPHANAQFYAEKIEEYLDAGNGTINDFIIPVINAIMVSGIIGEVPKEEAEKNVVRTATKAKPSKE